MSAISYKELELNYRKSVNVKGRKIYFIGVGNKDVYNITPPIVLPTYNGFEKFIVGRVENRYQPLESEIIFFREKEDCWVKASDMPSFKGEDPYVAVVHDKIILEFVEVKNGSFRTVILIGKNIESLKFCKYGPWSMKDIRIFERNNGRVGVFTRPQGVIGGRGTIGYFEIPDLKYINEDRIWQARLLDRIFVQNEWGGVNFPFEIGGKIGFIGHIARYGSDGNRNYTAILVENFNPNNFQFSAPKIIATRKEFPSGQAKRPDLKNVIFPGGLDEEGYLYCGYSDTEAGKIKIF